MAERPINLREHEVRNALANEVIQVRRVVKGAPADWSPMQPQVFSPTVIDRRGEEQPGPDAYGAGNEDGDCWIICPFGSPGDRLYGREKWAHDARSLEECRAAHEDIMGGMSYGPYYHATEVAPDTLKWRPSIHMPRWASRITLELTEVRVQRLQEISEADARAEGAPGYEEGADAPPPDGDHEWSYRASFSRLWESVNGPGSWAANQWLWAMTLRRIA